jgi:hypothetical protein
MAWILLHVQHTPPHTSAPHCVWPGHRVLGALFVALGLMASVSFGSAAAAPELQQLTPIGATAELTLAPIGGTSVPTAAATVPPTATRAPTFPPTKAPTPQAAFFNVTDVPTPVPAQVPLAATAAATATRPAPLPFSAVDHAIATSTGVAIAGQTAIPRATARAAATETVERALAVQATSVVESAIQLERIARATETTTAIEETARARAATVAPAQVVALDTMLSKMRLTGPADGQVLKPPTNRILPTPIPIRYAGVPATSNEASWINATTLWLGVPHRSQFDNSLYGPTNCGPTSLGMIFEAYGLKGYPTDAIRGEVNRISGDFNPDNGTSLYSIGTVAQRAGLYPIGLGKRWTLDDVRASLKAGRPVITLTRYADLPGNSYYGSDINHYIVLTGLAGDQIIYNDAAYSQGRGRGLMISPDALQRAWANSTIPGHSVAFAMNSAGDGLLSAATIARRAAEEEQLTEEEALVDEDETATELQGLARAVVFDSATIGETTGLVATGAGAAGSLVLSAQSERLGSLSESALVLIGLGGYSFLAVALILPRLRRSRSL